MPAASDDLMHSFYPLLANAMIQADLNSVEDEGSAAIGALAVEHSARIMCTCAQTRAWLHVYCMDICSSASTASDSNRKQR